MKLFKRKKKETKEIVTEEVPVKEKRTTKKKKSPVKKIKEPKWDCEKQGHKYKIPAFTATYGEESGRPESPVFMLECEECEERRTSVGKYWSYLPSLWESKKISLKLYHKLYKEVNKHLLKKQADWDRKNKKDDITVEDSLSIYIRHLNLLDLYDRNELEPSGEEKSDFILSYEECQKLISNVKKEIASKNDLFGKEKDGGLEKIVKNIYQTFDGKELYPTINAKASSLFYFIIKDHPFLDGNKRIGSILFIYFLMGCNRKKISIDGNCLVSLAILIAQSNPDDKDVIINLIQNFLTN